MRWLLAVIFDLSTKAVDIDHDCIVIDSDSISPDMLIDHIFGKNLLWMLHKHEKKCSLLGRQNQFFAVFVKAHRGCFVAERTTFQRIVAVQNHVFIASDHCLDFGSEDEWTEWFGDLYFILFPLTEVTFTHLYPFLPAP